MSAIDLLTKILPLLLVAVACGALIYGLTLLLDGRRTRVRTRINTFILAEANGPVDPAAGRNSAQARRWADVERRLTRLRWFRRWPAVIQYAGMHVTVTRLVVIQLAISLALAQGFAYLIPSFALLGIPISLWLGRKVVDIYLRSRGRRRITRFTGQLGDALAVLATAVRGGFSLPQALALIAQESPDPMGSEIQRVMQEVALGVPLDRALGGLLIRVPTDDVEMLVTAIALQQQTGGSLAHLLDVLATAVRERQRLQRQMKALTSQQRTSATLLASLPFILTGFLFLISPTYISPLFAPGWVLLIPGTAMMMSVLGYITMMKLGTINV